MKMKLTLGLALIFLSFFATPPAFAAFIDFEELSDGELVHEQYVSDGITFTDNFYASGQATASATRTDQDPLNSSNLAITPDNPNEGVYLLFNSPVYSFSALLYGTDEPAPEDAEDWKPPYDPDAEPEPEPEDGETPAPEPTYSENSIFFDAWTETAGGTLAVLNSDPVIYQTPGAWLQISFANATPISAVRFIGFKYFALDDISTSEPTNTVPEPTTVSLFGMGLAGLAGMKKRKKL